MKKTKILILALVAMLCLALASCSFDIDFEIPSLPDGGGALPGGNADGGNTGGADNGGGSSDESNPGEGVGEGGDNTQGGNTDGAEDGDEDDGGETGVHTHSYEWKTVTVPTCGEDGSELGKCSCGDEKSRAIPATGKHNEVVVGETETMTGRTECLDCGKILKEDMLKNEVRFSNADAYNSDYGYNTLANLQKGEQMQSFYERLEVETKKFRDGELDYDESYVFATVKYSDLGLSYEQAQAVWAVYRADHPLYFWFSSGILGTSQSIYVKVDENYLDGELRASYTKSIYKAAEKIVLEAEKANSIYEKTLKLHDTLIKSIEYAYDENGYPESESWAHNVFGVFLEGSAVCEGYAKAFHMLLNIMEIDNAYATGTSRGVGHAWNTVKLDDGRWYWYDLTWDDQPQLPLGVAYNYFAVSAVDNTSWQDMADNSRVAYFLDDHQLASPDVSSGLNYQYALPATSDEPFSSAELILRKTTFTVDGFTYVFAGPDAVALIEISGEGAVTVPETVTYNGRTLNVEIIGRFEGGAFYSDKISDEKLEITSVYIPKTVEYIFYGAFNFLDLEAITVSGENACYASSGDILYSKDYTAIEWIPQGIRGSVVIRSEVTDFSRLRFTYAYNVTSVTLPSGLSEIPANCFKGCTRLTEIHIELTEAQWNAVTKGADWAADSDFTVYLKDATLKVSKEN